MKPNLQTFTQYSRNLHKKDNGILSGAKAREAARRELSRQPDSPLRDYIIALLHEYYYLTGDQMRRLCELNFPGLLSNVWQSFDRTLARYRQRGWIMPVPEQVELYKSGMEPMFPFTPIHDRSTDNRLRIWTLGQVGECLAVQRGLKRGYGPTPYTIAHDVLCAEVCLRIVEARGGRLIGPRRLIYTNPANGNETAIQVRPDAMIRLKNRILLVEYMNQRSMLAKNVAGKISVYLRVLRTDRIKVFRDEIFQHWMIDRPLSFLFVYRTPGVWKAIEGAFEERFTRINLPETAYGLCLSDSLNGFPDHIHIAGKSYSPPDPTKKRLNCAPAYVPSPPGVKINPRIRARQWRLRMGKGNRSDFLWLGKQSPQRITELGLDKVAKHIKDKRLRVNDERAARIKAEQVEAERLHCEEAKLEINQRAEMERQKREAELREANTRAEEKRMQQEIAEKEAHQQEQVWRQQQLDSMKVHLDFYFREARKRRGFFNIDKQCGVNFNPSDALCEKVLPFLKTYDPKQYIVIEFDSWDETLKKYIYESYLCDRDGQLRRIS